MYVYLSKLNIFVISPRWIFILSQVRFVVYLVENLGCIPGCTLGKY